jgi:hypothetical protein
VIVGQMLLAWACRGFMFIDGKLRIIMTGQMTMDRRPGNLIRLVP